MRNVDFFSFDRSARKMGKSNKFDYTNRKNSGVPLGQVIGKALDSEADKVRKDAVKQAAKARKVSIGSSNSDNQDSVVHHIDLKAPSKALGDHGVAALADGLESALRKGTSDSSLALEDVNLSDNKITVASLARLAPIIKLARHDIKTLNLSRNHIAVVTDAEAEQWELFLQSFRDCYKLRRLDLSHNAGLGGRAMEVLARVHIREDQVTPLPLRGEASVHSLGDYGEADVEEGGEEKEEEEEEEVKTSKRKSLADGCHLWRRSGLRSIPYITLSNIALTGNTGALWLSFVLEEHFYPNQLTNELNAVQSASGTVSVKSFLTSYLKDDTAAHFRAYQQGANGGIDWDDNESTLGKDGTMLLQKAEAVRRQTLLDDQSTLASTLGSSVVLEDVTNVLEAGTRRQSYERRFSRSSVNDRRASIRSIRTTDGGEHEASELESARKKIQRHIIAHDKVASVDLWRVALTLLHCSRIMLFSAPPTRKYYTGEPKCKVPPSLRPAMEQHPAFRDRSTPSHLPRKVVEHITSYVMPEKELALMTEEQRRAVFAWGQRRDTLGLERDWMKKDESQQVWMLLDGMGCLEYGQ